jgi:hypothetical protein
MSARDGPNDDNDMFDYKEDRMFDKNFGSAFDGRRIP